MNITPSHIRQQLTACYEPREAAALTRIVCCEILGQSSTDYYLDKDIILSVNEEENIQSILQRLLHFEPIQYIQQKAPFCGHEFKVAPGVLIPRPETEELISLILKEITPDAAILDIGTGSGCIAISLAKALPQAKVSAWDISEKALDIARSNNEALNTQVVFEQHDVLSYQPQEARRFDVIVSNPPYVTEKEKNDMEENVLNWEPSLALFVPDSDPLLFYRKIAELGLSLLSDHGKLFFEINRAYGTETVKMLKGLGYHSARTWKDFFSNERFVTAEK